MDSGQQGLRVHPGLLLRRGQHHGKHRADKGLSGFLVSCMQSQTYTHTYFSLQASYSAALSEIKKKKKYTHPSFGEFFSLPTPPAAHVQCG